MIPHNAQGLFSHNIPLLFLYTVLKNVFLLCFIYYTYVTSLNSDTVSDKGIKPTVKYSEYYSHNAQGLFSS